MKNTCSRLEAILGSRPSLLGWRPLQFSLFPHFRHVLLLLRQGGYIESEGWGSGFANGAAFRGTVGAGTAEAQA